MQRLAKVLPTVLALAAIAALLWQRQQVTALERRVATLTGEQHADDGEAAPAPRAGAATPRGDDRRVAQRLTALEQTVARIFRLTLARGQGREGGGGSDDEGGGGETTKRVANLREDVDALLTGEALSTDKGRKALHDIVQEVQQRQREQRRERWRKMRAAMQKERLDKLVADAGLNGAQRQQISEALDGERQQRRALMRQARAGQQPLPQAIKQVRALRQATDQEVRGLVDDKQYEAYRKMRDQRRRRW